MMKSSFHISCMTYLGLLVMGVGLQQHPARQLASVAAHAFMDAAVLFLQWKQWENVGLFCCHAVALSCPITQQCKRGGIPQFLHFFFFFTSSLPPIFSFTRSRSQRQTQARQGNWVNLQLLNSCVPVETAGQMGPTSTQTQTKAFTSIRDLSPTCILMRWEWISLRSPS